MKGLGILILVVLAIWLLWPLISRWLQRKASEKTEDFLRNAMGMPPRPGSRKARKMEKEQRKAAGQYQRSRGGERYGNRYYGRRESIIPKEYAEDVEFVEITDHSSTNSRLDERGEQKIYHESQVSEAEWVEIKTSTKKER